VSILLSLSRDLNLVKKIPAAENARSASTEVEGIVSSQLQAPPSSAWAAEQRHFSFDGSHKLFFQHCENFKDLH